MGLDLDDILEKAYRFVVFLQFMFFIVFIIENFSNLGNIEYEIDSGVAFIGGQSFSINLYAIFGAIAVLFGIVFLTTVNIFGSGVSEFGSSLFAKLVYFFSYYAILSIGSLYYLFALGNLTLILQFLITIIWVLHGLQLLNSNDNA